jgi:hypothetical protein
MKMEMYPIKIETDKDQNRVVISQDWAGEDQGIWVHPSQIPVLIEWLQKAKEEMEPTVRTVHFEPSKD